MEEKAKTPEDRHGPLWIELREKTKDDPKLAKMLDTAEQVMDRYRETLQRLADS